ncbi:hypothetical protein FHG87_023105 [Trinorchestia longiramus]|nr:hypothetical protein FHG87_023105 [Trinorchestia longiramus]
MAPKSNKILHPAVTKANMLNLPGKFSFQEVLKIHQNDTASPRKTDACLQERCSSNVKEMSSGSSYVPKRTSKCEQKFNQPGPKRRKIGQNRAVSQNLKTIFENHPEQRLSTQACETDTGLSLSFSVRLTRVSSNISAANARKFKQAPEKKQLSVTEKYCSINTSSLKDGSSMEKHPKSDSVISNQVPYSKKRQLQFVFNYVDPTYTAGDNESCLTTYQYDAMEYRTTYQLPTDRIISLSVAPDLNRFKSNSFPRVRSKDKYLTPLNSLQSTFQVSLHTANFADQFRLKGNAILLVVLEKLGPKDLTPKFLRSRGIGLRRLKDIKNQFHKIEKSDVSLKIDIIPPLADLHSELNCQKSQRLQEKTLKYNKESSKNYSEKYDFSDHSENKLDYASTAHSGLPMSSEDVTSGDCYGTPAPSKSLKECLGKEKDMKEASIMAQTINVVRNPTLGSTSKTLLGRGSVPQPASSAEAELLSSKFSYSEGVFSETGSGSMCTDAALPTERCSHWFLGHDDNENSVLDERLGCTADQQELDGAPRNKLLNTRSMKVFPHFTPLNQEQKEVHIKWGHEVVLHNQYLMDQSLDQKNFKKSCKSQQHKRNSELGNDEVSLNRSKTCQFMSALYSVTDHQRFEQNLVNQWDSEVLNRDKNNFSPDLHSTEAFHSRESTFQVDCARSSSLHDRKDEDLISSNDSDIENSSFHSSFTDNSFHGFDFIVDGSINKPVEMEENHEFLAESPSKIGDVLNVSMNDSFLGFESPSEVSFKKLCALSETMKEERCGDLVNFKKKCPKEQQSPNSECDVGALEDVLAAPHKCLEQEYYKCPCCFYSIHCLTLFIMHLQRHSQGSSQGIHPQLNKENRPKWQATIPSPKSSSLRRSHYSDLHSEFPHQCLGCPCNSVNLASFVQSQEQRRAEADDVFTCSVCSFQCFQLFTYEIHTLWHLKGNNYTCSLCPYRTPLYVLYANHVRCHKEQNRHKCDRCSFSHGHLLGLIIHKRVHEQQYSATF